MPLSSLLLVSFKRKLIFFLQEPCTSSVNAMRRTALFVLNACNLKLRKTLAHIFARATASVPSIKTARTYSSVFKIGLRKVILLLTSRELFKTKQRESGSAMTALTTWLSVSVAGRKASFLFSQRRGNPKHLGAVVISMESQMVSRQMPMMMRN